MTGHDPVTVSDVLVVGIDEQLAATADRLTRRGLDILTSPDPGSAWDVAQVARPRVVLLTVGSDATSHLALVERIRGDPRLADTRIVVVSPSRLDDPHRDTDPGADEYVLGGLDVDDLAERVRAQVRVAELLGRLRRSEERFRSLIGTQADAVLVVGTDGVIRFANPSAEGLFGEGPGSLTGRDFGAPIVTHDEEPTVQLRDRDGELVIAAMRVATVEWDDGPAWIVSLRDIRRQLLLEEQVRLAQRLESVGRLTGGIAHDFNNLLSVILTASEEIGRLVHADTKELADMITAAARRGSELTRSLLAFARRQPLAPVLADVGRLLTEMTPMLQRTLGDSIDVIVEIPHGPPLLTHVDRAGFESAILNLCVNGRDAMETGGRIRLVVDAWSSGGGDDDERDERLTELDGDEYVRVAVVDEGTGIEPSHLPHVFEPFFTTKALGVGTGLGLPMVYGFALQSGGAATIDSALGAGTTVSLFLPRATSTPPPTPPEPADDTPLEAIPAGVRVLLVEDGDPLRELLARQLHHLGHEVTAVATAQEAIHAISEGSDHDLLLTDIRLGGPIDGHDLVVTAREQRPDLAVLLMSGLPPSELPDAGARVEILRKPFGRGELAAGVERALSDRVQRDESR